jgi:hypothetical protein
MASQLWRPAATDITACIGHESQDASIQTLSTLPFITIFPPHPTLWKCCIRTVSLHNIINLSLICCSCRQGETMSLNCGHLRDYCSSSGWYTSMEPWWKLYKEVKQSHNTPTEAHEERRYSSYSLTTSALDEEEWSASRPGRALPLKKGPERKETPVPIGEEAGWASEQVWTQEVRRKIFCLCRGSNLDRPVVQSIARHWLSYPGWCKLYWQGNPEKSKKTCPTATSSTTADANQGLRGDGPATNWAMARP